LLAADADLDARDTWNRTPIDISHGPHPELSCYLQSIVDDPSKRPTWEEVVEEQTARLKASGKRSEGQYTEVEDERAERRRKDKGRLRTGRRG
jgi:hypothetical protein